MTAVLQKKQIILSFIQDKIAEKVEETFCEIFGYSNGEDIYLCKTDTEVRKNREQTGLGTLVVYSVNDEC